SLSAETLGRVLREYYIGLIRFREHYYYKVGNGASWIQAVAPILRRALDRGYLRVSQRLSLCGLVVFPGVFIGLLMMDANPWYAVVVTAVLLVATLAFQVLAIVLSVFLTQRIVTTLRGQITDIIIDKHLLRP
ncbi:MAG: ABC transporter permease, partial [Prevotella sp.]|nr:ABC transporter permease [Prevotella sp.]